MRIQVTRVMIPVGSSIGYGIGEPEGDSTKEVVFAGHWRPMAGLGEMIAAADEPIVIDIPEWSVLEIRELP